MSMASIVVFVNTTRIPPFWSPLTLLLKFLRVKVSSYYPNNYLPVYYSVFSVSMSYRYLSIPEFDICSGEKIHQSSSKFAT